MVDMNEIICTLNVSSLYSPAMTVPMSMRFSLTDRLTTGLTPFPFNVTWRMDVPVLISSTSWN